MHTKGFRLLAHPARFERATFRLGGGRSIRLSYGRMSSFYLDFSGRKEYIPYIALCQGRFWNLRLCLCRFTIEVLQRIKRAAKHGHKAAQGRKHAYLFCSFGLPRRSLVFCGSGVIIPYRLQRISSINI